MDSCSTYQKATVSIEILTTTRFALLTTTASMVGVVTSLVLGVLVGAATFHSGGRPRSMAVISG
jgi:hypothetical protein